ncbi:uncharacterized protein VTP21DRAFT_7870 [Calcarisporiella thermophila]|uniref:uncharacterized protein n=1 Tax=Calcarisporiella thermophila TaxID=911321 RepID=UPI0037424F37
MVLTNEKLAIEQRILAITVLDDVQPNPVAITKQFDNELQRGIKSKWWMAMKQERKRDFIDKWSRGNWVNIIDDSVIFIQSNQIPSPTPA